MSTQGKSARAARKVLCFFPRSIVFHGITHCDITSQLSLSSASLLQRPFALRPCPLLSEVQREYPRREPFSFQQVFAAATLFLAERRAHSRFRRTTDRFGNARQQKICQEVQRDAALRLPACQEYSFADVCESEAGYFLQFSRLQVQGVQPGSGLGDGRAMSRG